MHFKMNVSSTHHLADGVAMEISGKSGHYEDDLGSNLCASTE